MSIDEKLARLLALHPKHHGLYITHNDFKAVYEDCATYLSHRDLEPEEQEACLKAGEVWCVQLYPNSPVGFNWTHWPTLEGALDRMIKLEEE